MSWWALEPLNCMLASHVAKIFYYGFFGFKEKWRIDYGLKVYGAKNIMQSAIINIYAPCDKKKLAMWTKLGTIGKERRHAIYCGWFYGNKERIQKERSHRGQGKEAILNVKLLERNRWIWYICRRYVARTKSGWVRMYVLKEKLKGINRISRNDTKFTYKILKGRYKHKVVLKDGHANTILSWLCNERK